MLGMSSRLVFDAHSHAFPDQIAAGAVKALSSETIWEPVCAHHDGTVRGLLAGMDAAGVHRTILCSVATKPTQVRKITDWSASIMSDRIFPFASIHPDYDQPEAEIRRIASLGLKGLKVHPQYMRCPLDDERFLRIARAAARSGLALVTHSGYDVSFPADDLASPRRIRALHDAVPDLRLMACHMGGWKQWEQALECLAGQPIYMETSFALDGQCPPDLLHRLLDRHGADFLLFGTDSPWLDQTRQLSLFEQLPLSDDAKRRCLWDNACRFLGIECPTR